jgi:hypothetical protein
MTIRQAGAASLLVWAAMGGGCGEGDGGDAPFVNIRVTYVSRLPPGCPDIANICYPGCAHHNAPAGLQAVVPLWGADTLRLTEAGSGRYEGVLTAVPTNAPLRLYGRDIGMCCVDACSYGPVLEDILVNGTKLTKVVREGLPTGVSAALEFSVDGRGTVRQ